MDDLAERLRSLAEPVLARHGATLVDVEVKRGRTQLVRVIADQPGGIDLDTCAQVSAELSRMLDVDDPLDGRYTLEVASPGLDRPLRTEEDFRRNLGRVVRVVLEASQVEGIVEDVDAETVRVAGERIRLDAIRKAKIVLPW